MTYPRKTLISLEDTPYYHVISRCVRRAWLWGVDEYAGRDYSHRKAWVLDRLQQLTSVFAIDVCAYAVMSDHYHLVLHVDRARAHAWSEKEVIERWRELFSIPEIVERSMSGTASEAERSLAREFVEQRRQRLYDVSWFMRCLNEYLARRANAEDDCTGRFWEGRFKSQALLDEAGLLTAMAYVDLNRVRAGIAKTPEESEFTSIYERIRCIRLGRRSSPDRPVKLMPFQDERRSSSTAIPFRRVDYIRLIDWTGRARRHDKRGSIDRALPPILLRLHIDAKGWRTAMRTRSCVFGRAVGRLERMRLHAKALGQSWIRGMYQTARLFTMA